MKVTVRSFANIKDVLGAPEITAELPQAATLADLLRLLSGTYGPAFDRQVKDQTSGELVPFLILVNGATYRSVADMSVPVQDGDVVTLMIPFDGG
jgi:MoaD family protein